ncbi:MAG: ATP-binding protein [Candidatus Aenigmarchaeota archaeon]|nr:ATP-binding protein [Candidatus Aenigmarchaeota archaeon]
MKIVVASGKGGVGKSMLASSLVVLLSKEREIVACDCDVDAPNLGLWLGVTNYDEVKRISTSEKAFIIDADACKGKLKPSDCKFGAIEIKEGKLWINPFLCEGCGVCKLLCKDGVELKPVENGEIRITKTKYGFTLVSAQLYPGEKGSGKVVEELRRHAEKFGGFILMDAAAGIGCPVIASLRGVDYAIMVTEPTLSGLSDLKRVMSIANHFKVPYSVVINKYDINEGMSKKIEEEFGDKILGKISYDKSVIDAIVNLKPVVETESKVVEEIKQIFERLKEEIKI